MKPITLVVLAAGVLLAGCISTPAANEMTHACMTHTSPQGKAGSTRDHSAKDGGAMMKTCPMMPSGTTAPAAPAGVAQPSSTVHKH